MTGPPLTIDEIVKDPRGLLDYALGLPPGEGVRVEFATLKQCRDYRFRLYSLRNSWRRASRTDFLPNDANYDGTPWDGLSFLIYEGSVVSVTPEGETESRKAYTLRIVVASPEDLGIQSIGFPEGHEPENIEELQKDLEG